jgi:hypothetical protein
MAQKLTNHNMFNAEWTEKDEAVLYDLLKRKIGELRYDIKDCPSPFARAKLKQRRKEYIHLLGCVERGTYNSAVLAAEMASYKYNLQQTNATAAGGGRKDKKYNGKYVDSYAEMSFDFESYFRKSRYLGTALPFVALLLTIAFMLVLMCSVFFPRDFVNRLDSGLQTQNNRLSLSSVMYFKLTEEDDILVANDGRWPKGTYMDPENELPYDTLYYDNSGMVPSEVWLYKDLGMVAIDVTNMDIIKAFFYTPLMQATSIDAVESFLFKDDQISWYYRYYMRGREDDLKIHKNEDGKYTTVNVVNTITTYGTIFAFLALLILGVLQIIVCICRLFSYTSRRLHFIPLLMLLCFAATLLFPVFGKMAYMSGSDVSAALKGYFTMQWTGEGGFLEKETPIAVNFLYVFLNGILILLLLLPLFFKNKAIKQATYVPKGNRAHTYPGQAFPTKAGELPQTVSNPALPAARKPAPNAPVAARPTGYGNMNARPSGGYGGGYPVRPTPYRK